MLKHLFLLGVFLVMALVAYSQTADAGPDKVICKGDTTSIGSEGIGQACYYWSPAIGLNDPTSPTPIANPEETTTYTLTVISDDLSSRTTDEVTVSVSHVILDFKAVPNKCCWADGDTIQLEDFTFLTVPPGLEGDIKVKTAQAEVLPILPYGQMQAEFSFQCALNELSTSVEIDVVNEEKVTAKPDDDLIEPFKLLEDKISKFKFGPCEPGLSIQPTVQATVRNRCCSGSSDCIKLVAGYAGGIQLGANMECEFPLPWSLPYVAEIEVEINLGIAGTVQLEGEEGCDDATNLCFAGDLNGMLSGFVEFELFDGDALEAGVGLETNLILPNFLYCPANESLEFVKKAGKQCQFGYDVKGVIMVELFSAYTVDYKLVIIPETCF